MWNLYVYIYFLYILFYCSQYISNKKKYILFIFYLTLFVGNLSNLHIFFTILFTSCKHTFFLMLTIKYSITRYIHVCWVDSSLKYARRKKQCVGYTYVYGVKGHRWNRFVDRRKPLNLLAPTNPFEALFSECAFFYRHRCLPWCKTLPEEASWLGTWCAATFLPRPRTSARVTRAMRGAAMTLRREMINIYALRCDINENQHVGKCIRW